MAGYSETLTEHVMAPRNGGTIERADLIAHTGTPGRGAFMIIYVKVSPVGHALAMGKLRILVRNED